MLYADLFCCIWFSPDHTQHPQSLSLTQLTSQLVQVVATPVSPDLGDIGTWLGGLLRSVLHAPLGGETSKSGVRARRQAATAHVGRVVDTLMEMLLLVEEGAGGELVRQLGKGAVMVGIVKTMVSG